MAYVAGIVVFNPDMVRLKENIEAIIPQVEKVIVIDNGSEDENEILSFLEPYKSTVCIRNTKNMGIAKALNQIVSKADELGYKWVLTLDQDSVCSSKLIETYEAVIKKEKNLGMVSSQYADRNVKIDFKDDTEIKEVDFCITSAAYTNIEAVKSVGGFDEKMFIDMVDYDICYALKRNGYRIVRVNYIGFLHEVGKSVEKKFLGKKTIVFNHSHMRKYYWARNTMYLMRKYKLSKFNEYKRILKMMLDTLFFEKEKFKKLKWMFKGIKDSKKL